MEARTIRPFSREYRDVKALYLSAFPEEQRYPAAAVWLWTGRRPCVRARAYYEGDTFLGLSYGVDTERYYYICYLAVAPSLRSQGRGSEIMNELKAQAPSRDLIVEIETLEADAPNYTQRVARAEFYRRNGFYALDHHLETHGVRYDILSTSLEFDAEEYWSIFPKMAQPALARLKRLAQILRLWR